MLFFPFKFDLFYFINNIIELNKLFWEKEREREIEIEIYLSYHVFSANLCPRIVETAKMRDDWK